MPTYFSFCIHNHQPSGNFGHVLEEAYESSYWPFLKALSRHPFVKVTLHNSGYLLDWIADNRPEYIELLRELVARGQVEVMGGGYYEPVLAVIPEEDRVSQILMMSERIEALFGKRPRGIWLAERVWEPSLPTTLRKASVEYILVDDYHFIKSGLQPEELGGYYMTEDQGNAMKVFPGSERLRYLIPFKPVNDLKEHLQGLKGRLKRGNAAIYGDDGEKFGVWPGTRKWVFDDGWLDEFFEMVEGSLGWLTPVTLSELTDMEDPLGRVYLPTTSYMEMGEWALPAEASREYTELVEEVKRWSEGDKVRRFLQGGMWRNFFAKYPEADWMHKRMLMVSRLVREAFANGAFAAAAEAREHLFRAQCNDAYWHGVFGGLYLPHLRKSVYENLIRAEGKVLAPVHAPVIESLDMDADGHEELLLRTRDINLFVSPRRGGALMEFDYTPAAVNLSNTLSRWHEGYHDRLSKAVHEAEASGAKSIHEQVRVKEKGLEKLLVFDSARRASFVERVIGAEVSHEGFMAGNYEDPGGFASGAYDASVERGVMKLNSVAGNGAIRKSYAPVSDSGFSVSYRVGAGVAAVKDAFFSVELNLIFPCCDGPACQMRITQAGEGREVLGLGATGAEGAVKRLTLTDTLARVTLDIDLDRVARLWRHPVYTVSISEDGFEKIYQGTCLVFSFPLDSLVGGAGPVFTLTAGGLK